MGKEFTVLQWVWDQAMVFICTFHVLQAVWRWLNASHHHVPGEQKVPLLASFKGLLYFSSKDNTDVGQAFEDAKGKFLKEERVVQHGKTWVQYLKSFFTEPKQGSVFTCFRHSTLDRAQETNNMCEAPNRMIKHDVLESVKAWNVVHLLHVLSEALEGHFCDRILKQVDMSTDLKQFFIKWKVGKELRVGGVDTRLVRAKVAEEEKEKKEEEKEEKEDKTQEEGNVWDLVLVDPDTDDDSDDEKENGGGEAGTRAAVAGAVARANAKGRGAQAAADYYEERIKPYTEATVIKTKREFVFIVVSRKEVAQGMFVIYVCERGECGRASKGDA